MAQPRDGVLKEQALEEEAAKCLDDPDCAKDAQRAIRLKQNREDAAEAKFQALPWWEKLFRWSLIPLAFIGLYRWIGRK